MFLLIDGYNVLHMCGFIGRNVGPGSLKRARGTLLGELARKLSLEQRKRTTIVFDSAEEFSHLDTSHVVWEMHVEFATGHDQADDRIEQLIRRHSSPKQLTVVSSDHRLQQAAKRRGATFANSEDWMDQVNAAYASASRSKDDPQPQESEMTGEDVEKWKDFFDLPDDLSIETDNAPDSVKEEPSRDETETYDPFPPGYADDLLEDD